MLRRFKVAVLIICSKFVYASTFIIGVQAPITGKFASEGQAIKNSVQLLVDQQNASKSIKDVTFKVISCDDQGLPQQAVICAKSLVEQGAKAVIGSYTSTATEAAQAIYAKAGVIQTSDATASSLVKNAGMNTPTYFRNSFNDNIEGEFTAKYLSKYHRIAILSDQSSFATGLANAVVVNLKRLNEDVVYNGKIDASKQDFKAVLTEIASKTPDVIYYSGYYTEGSALRKQEQELNIKADFVGGNSNDNPEFISIAGKSAIGSYLIGLPQPSQLKSASAQNFLKSYKARYKSDIPSIWTLTNSDGLLAIFAAIKATNSTDSRVIAKYIRGSLRDLPVNTGTMTIDTSGERIGNLYQVSVIGNDLQYKKVY